VIAPDLSNLPEGATAIDAETGETFHRPEDSKQRVASGRSDEHLW